MAHQFDTLLEGQKKMFEFWSTASKKMVDNMSDPFKKEENKENKEDKEDFLGNWFEFQKKIWEETMKFKNFQKVYDKAPEQLQEWAKMQTEFAQKWMNFYSENSERFGIKMPPINGYANPDFFAKTPKDWSEWVEKATKWWQDNLMMKLPFPQDFHFKNFNDLYGNMNKFWEPIQRMIEHGVDDWKGIGLFMTPEQYQKIIGQFMGMGPIGNLPDMLGQANEMFEASINWLKDLPTDGKSAQEKWKSMMEKFGDWDNSNVSQVILGLNATIRDGLESMYSLAGQNKEMEMIRVIKDIQFTYIAFVLKSADMQAKVLKAGQFALPDTIRFFGEKLETEKQLPDYQSFFNQYVNILEKYMIEVLESKEYSIIQNEVAKTGITVKSKMDELVELTFSDFPFLMQSHADEVAVENIALRKKIRSLEKRMAALENREVAVQPITVENSDLQEELLAGIGRADITQKDDLKQIKGIGPKLEKMLHSIGIFTFEQVSKMTKEHYKMMDTLLDAFQGRALRDEWAEQAKTMYSK